VVRRTPNAPLAHLRKSPVIRRKSAVNLEQGLVGPRPMMQDRSLKAFDIVLARGTATFFEIRRWPQC
jgi:hypothetical protein